MARRIKVFNIDPVAKPRMVKSDAWKKRKCVLNYWAFKDELCLHKKGFEIKDNMSYEFIIAMPKGWSNKKKKLIEDSPHKQKPDLDNLLKALWDCLLIEDSHISSVSNISKKWGYSGKIIIKEL